MAPIVDIDNHAGKVMAEDLSDAMDKIRNAFTLFDSQSVLLKRSYDRLRIDFARTNNELNEKNKTLSLKLRELEEMSGRLQCIIESLTDSVLIVDVNMKIERCNRAAEVLLGIARDKVVSRSYSEVCNGFGDTEKLHRVIADGEMFLDDERQSGKGSVASWVLASVAPIYSPDGMIIGAIEVLRDVTHLKMLESKVDLHKRMSALGQMAASVAHEIRNPLGTIEGFAGLLKRDLAGMPAHQNLASKIVEGAKNLNYIITNLLEYTRPAFLEKATFEASCLVSDVGDALTAKAVGSGVQLELESENVTLQGDSRQLRQVLVNIGLNAIEACTDAGTVRIHAGAQGDCCVFTVRDNGRGISKEDITRLFDPFFTTKSGGTGLGLALCHKIVTAHGGELKVSSMAGEGTSFEVVLSKSGGEE